MRTSTLSLALIGSLALAACSGASVATWPNRAALDVNPLYVYAEQSLLAQHLTNLQIGGHFSSGALATALESAKRSALRASQDAQASMQAGWGGTFVPGEDDTSGHVVLLPTGLFFSPDFFIAPGADVHVYLPTAVDPRGRSGVGAVWRDACAGRSGAARVSQRGVGGVE
jgi:hypothetical protein